MNPLIKSAQIKPQMIKDIKYYMEALKVAQNPNKALVDLSQNNPQLKEIMDLCQGRNPKDVFVERCNQLGLDPQEIIQLLM